MSIEFVLLSLVLFHFSTVNLLKNIYLRVKKLKISGLLYNLLETSFSLSTIHGIFCFD